MFTAWVRSIESSDVIIEDTDGWVDFLIRGSGAYPEIDNLGFLTRCAIQKIYNACGDDYTTRDLMVDSIARGPTWLPVVVLGVLPCTLSADVHVKFMERLVMSNL